MSRRTETLYLLRLRNEYRYDGDYQEGDDWRIPANAPYERAFASREAAVAWTEANPPIGANPFDRAGFYGSSERWYFDYMAGEPRREQTMVFAYYNEGETESEPVAITPDADAEETEREVAVLFAVDWLREIIGVRPPPIGAESDRTTWIAWWNNGAGGANDDQKREIWRFFVPVPYTLVCVELAPP